MSYGHWVQAIEGSIGELKGVEKVFVALEYAKVTVQFDADAAYLEKIKETIDDQGYNVE
ncbi:copper chaperone [Mesobacillus foraminis]|uniref:Copper chaperone n=2 Tax=Mesobacillus foraminis TaxID=279826 RepID=A0A4R2B312_9BACI|nr:copper chaperone [Mesobacillus foraminis]